MNGPGIVTAVCTSPGKGTPKEVVPGAVLVRDHGLEGDAHAGPGDRQVSILSREDIDDFRRRVPDLAYGAFGENLVLGGLDLAALGVGSRLRIGQAELEIARIGKECHHACSIRERAGDCIMPRRGLFAVVRCGGPVAPGDEVAVIRIVPAEAPATLDLQASPPAREDRS